MNIHYNNIHPAVKYGWGGHGRLTGTWGVELSGMGGGRPWGTRGNTGIELSGIGGKALFQVAGRKQSPPIINRRMCISGIELSGIGGKAHTLSICQKEAKPTNK